MPIPLRPNWLSNVAHGWSRLIPASRKLGRVYRSFRSRGTRNERARLFTSPNPGVCWEPGNDLLSFFRFFLERGTIRNIQDPGNSDCEFDGCDRRSEARRRPGKNPGEPILEFAIRAMSAGHFHVFEPAHCFRVSDLD